MKLFSNQYIKYTLFTFVGLFLGWLFFHSSETKNEHQHSVDEKLSEVWTCAMHPQIRKNEPGKCPICAMDLILLNQNSAEAIDPNEIHFTKEAAQLANVQTTVVTTENPVKEVRLFGKVQADERLLQSQVAHIPGRIERLYVNFTGESVRKGQLIALIYSPELVTAQQELLETVKTKEAYPEIYEASKEKLLQWKLSSKQIAAIESSKKVKTNMEVYATSSGTITSKYVNVGDYVGVGSPLFEVTDLSRVWILFDAYESDLQFLKKGNSIDFKIEAIPTTTFNGVINFIDPVIDPSTRVAKVRLEVANNDGKLKPEMFATGFVKSTINHSQNKLVIPKSAVLWTGKRSIVYVKKPGNDPIFNIRTVELGEMLGASYVIESGLFDGEEVVTQGAFSVDAAAQLEGKPSMMNTETNNTATDHLEHSSSPSPEKKPSEKTLKQTKIDSKIVVSKEFQQQLKLTFNNYIKIKNALANDNSKTAQKWAIEFLKSLKNVDLKLVTDKKAQSQWLAINKELQTATELISKNLEIDKQRVQFIVMSKSMLKSIKTFGINQKVYEQFCPMGNSDNGAIWLSTEEKIINPYFGAAMLQCGTIQSIIEN